MTDTPTPRQAATEGPEGASQPREGAGRPPGPSQALSGAVEGSGGNDGPTVAEAAADDEQHWGVREWEGE